MTNSVGTCLLLLLPAILTTIALITSGASTFYCESIKFEPLESPTANTSFPAENPTLRFGLYGYKVIDNANANNNPSTIRGGIPQASSGSGLAAISQDCRNYDTSQISLDASWKVGRVFGVFSFLIGIVLTLYNYIAVCNWCGMASNETYYKGIAIVGFIIILPLFQGLTFMILQSDLCWNNPFFVDNPNIAQQYNTTQCQMDNGGIANIIAILLWIVVGISMLILGLPQKTRRGGDDGGRRAIETQQVTYQQTTDANGITTIGKTGVVKGTYVK